MRHCLCQSLCKEHSLKYAELLSCLFPFSEAPPVPLPEAGRRAELRTLRGKQLQQLLVLVGAAEGGGRALRSPVGAGILREGEREGEAVQWSGQAGAFWMTGDGILE